MTILQGPRVSSEQPEEEKETREVITLFVTTLARSDSHHVHFYSKGDNQSYDYQE